MTLRLRSGFGRCGTTPMRRRTAAGSVLTFAPATTASPDVMRTRVVRMPMSVVFPAPFGPRTPKNSPSVTARSSESMATMPREGGGGGAGTPRRFLIEGAGYTFRNERLSMAFIGDAKEYPNQFVTLRRP